MVELTNQELCDHPVRTVKCKVLNKMAPTELKELNKNMQLFGIFGRTQFDPIYTVTIVDESGKQIKEGANFVSYYDVCSNKVKLLTP